jgi:capsular exopolysaccharide synthesis family protein
MSRIRSLLQRASWLEEKASSPETITGTRSSSPIPARKNHGLGDSPELSHIEIEQVVIPPESRLVYHTDPHGPAADGFRTLRLRLRPLWNTGKLRKILITSPLPGDGKSTVAINLATALAERGKRTVVLVEADLHHSPITKNLGLSPRPGFAECLEEGRNALELVRHLNPLDWYLLPAGKPRSNATELLQGQVLPVVVDLLAAHFDWMVVDSPPAIPLSEVLSLKNHTDASVLVVRAGRTSQDAVEEALALLGKQHVQGIILNGIQQGDLVYHKYGYYDNYNGRPSGGRI